MPVTDMDKTIRKYASFEEMKADEYREWQALPCHERLRAITELLSRYTGSSKRQPMLNPDFNERLSVFNDHRCPRG